MLNVEMILIVLDQMLYNDRSRSLAERTPDEDIVGGRWYEKFGPRDDA